MLSGVFEGKTLGTPIGMVIANEDTRSGDYREIQEKYSNYLWCWWHHGRNYGGSRCFAAAVEYVLGERYD